MENKKTKIIDAYSDGEALVEILNSGAVLPLKVTGSSMLPFLKEKRDTVWLIRKDELKRGQIVFFRRRNGSFVLHRIRRIYPDGRILINGDAQNWCEIISREQVIAVVTAVESKNKGKIDTDGVSSRIRDLLWFPTRPVRPLIFKIYALLKR